MADSLRRRMMMGQGGGDYSKQYLTFTCVGTRASNLKYTGADATNMQYSIDGGSTWVTLSKSEVTPSLEYGESIMFKAEGLSSNSSSGTTFGYGNSSFGFAVSGNIMSLLYGDDFIGKTTITNNYQFYRLFYNFTTLRDASNLVLPATTLSQRCYADMFYGCTSLASAPQILPATTLQSYCYTRMFYGCSSLVTAPKLPAINLGSGCYNNMFYNCTSLITAPELPATTLAAYCYNGMLRYCSSLNYIKCLATDISAGSCLADWVSGVASKGTFIANPNTSWSTGASGIPTNWVRKSSVDYTRLLYSLYDYSTDGTEATAIDTGVKLFDGSLTGYRLEIDAVLTEIPSTYAGFVSCWGTTDNHQLLLIQGVADSTGDYNDIQIALRPLISGRTVIPTLGDGDILLGYVEGNLNKVRYNLTTGADNIYRSDYATGTTQPHDSHLYVGKDPNNRYTKMVVNALRIFEIPTP